MCLYIIGKHWGSFLSHCIKNILKKHTLVFLVLTKVNVGEGHLEWGGGGG